jgi:hypothetical protein
MSHNLSQIERKVKPIA